MLDGINNFLWLIKLLIPICVFPECDTSFDSAQKQVVLIDSLLTVDGSSSAHVGARKHNRDIAEVAGAAELLLPRGSARISGIVSCFGLN